MNFSHPELRTERTFHNEPEKGGGFGGFLARFRGRTKDVVEKPSIPRLNDHLLDLLSQDSKTFQELLDIRRSVQPDLHPTILRSALRSLVDVKSVTYTREDDSYSITAQGMEARRKMKM